MRYVVEKIPVCIEVTCGGSRVIVVNIEILIFSEEQKRRILRDYYRDDRPKSVCWAADPIRKHLVVRGQVNVDIEVRASEWRKVTGHDSSGKWFEDKCLLGFNGVEVRRVDLPLRATFWAVPLLRIIIRKE